MGREEGKMRRLEKLYPPSRALLAVTLGPCRAADSSLL